MVAAGVGCCTLGNPLTRIANTAEAGLLVAACCLPCLSLVGKEALMLGKQPVSIPMVGLVVCIAQLIAIARPQNWPPTLAAPPWASASALHIELAALWHSGPLTYVIVSGLLRVSILVLISNSSASTLQLVNAVAVPLVATILTSGNQQNVDALLLALGGTALYVLGHREQVAKAVAPSMSNKVRQRTTYMDEVRQEKKEQKDADQVRLELQQKENKQQERLGRLMERWTLLEKQQQEIEKKQQQQQPPEPLMYAPEDG